VTELAPSAPDKLEKENCARPIQPGQWFPPRTIDFIITTVGTPFPTDFNHHNPFPRQIFYAERFGSSSVASFFRRFRGGCKNSAASSSLQFLCSATSFMACSRVSWVSAGGEYGFFFLRVISNYDLHLFCTLPTKFCHAFVVVIHPEIVFTKSERCGSTGLVPALRVFL